MKKKTKILFRADGNSKIGLGHVIRSLAFADMITQHFECYFIIKDPSSSIQSQIKEVCDHLICLEDSLTMDQEIQFLTQILVDKGSIVVLDGYHFKTDYQKSIKAMGFKLICIDDINAYHFVADVIINHAGGFTTQEYSKEANSKLLLGPSYALLRSEFQEAAKKQTKEVKANSIFICFGGADPQNDTLHVLQECIIHKPNDTYNIVLGSAFLHLELLEKFIQKEGTSVNIFRNLNALEMVDLMQTCPMAVTSPSTVSYEYLGTGGKLFLKVIADNQNRINDYLISNNLAFDFSNFSREDQVIQNSTLQNALFDGNQKKRYIKLLHELMLAIEKASEKDIKLYFDWANDPDTRSQSFHSDLIPWESHTKWFLNRIESDKFVFYKGKISTADVGQIRYDLNTNEALINYSVDSGFRGLGIGYLLIEKTLSLIAECFDEDFEIIGFVKHNNIASVKVFRKLGFEELEATEYDNTYKYILKCKM